MSSSWHHIFTITPDVYIEIYQVGDSRRTVNTWMTPHISDQLGTENTCETLLCWFIIMIWVLVCDNLIICIDMNVILDLSTAIQQFREGFDKWLDTNLFYWNTTMGKILSPMYVCQCKMWKSNVKNFLSHVGLSGWSQTTWYSSDPGPRSFLTAQWLIVSAHSWQSERQNIIDRTYTWQQCLVTTSGDILTTKYGFNLRFHH